MQDRVNLNVSAVRCRAQKTKTFFDVVHSRGLVLFHPSLAAVFPIMNVILLVCVLGATASGFLNDEPVPHMLVDDYPKKLVHTFIVDDRIGENLRILLVEGDHVLIGGWNVLHNVSMSSMQSVSNISWNPSALSFANCQKRVSVDTACGNFIRMVMRLSADSFLLCGTHAYTPRCRVYKYRPSVGFVWKTDIDGKVVCPADGNQSAVFVLSGRRLVAAVSSHPETGRLPLLYANPVQTDRRQLNSDAVFVGVVSGERFIYFFLRETALEGESCGKTASSTVLRVCSNDPGTRSSPKTWTTLAKARLRCSLNGSTAFDFPHIQDVSSTEPFGPRQPARTVYAIFSATGNPIQSSAVCVFDVDTINAALRGAEDNCSIQDKSGTNAASESQVFSREPLLVHVGFDYHYTSIAADEQVEATSGNKFDVVYVGTSHGHVVKVTDVGQDANDKAGTSTVVIEDVCVFPEGQVVRQLQIARNLGTVDTLLVATYHEVVSVPLDNCNWTARTCAECVGLQDPYCAWDVAHMTCRSLLKRANRSGVIQNVTWGRSSLCGDGQSVPTWTARTVKGNELAGQKRGFSFYSARTLGLAVSFCILPSVLIGVITGYWFGDQRKKSLFYFNYK